MTSARLHHIHARLYQTLRTAHLERAHELSPATILYRTRRYDFDDRLVEGLDLVAATPFRAARLLFSSRVVRLEINEPLMLPSLPGTVAAIGALRLRAVLHGTTAMVVTYAIGNADPFTQNAPGGSALSRVRTRLRRGLERCLARWTWARVDRVVFGSQDAMSTYARLLGAAPGAARTIVALSSAYPAAGTHPVTPNSVVFLGALVERKGILVLLRAWPLVVAARPGSKLIVLGTGRLQGIVEKTAKDDSTMSVEIDPTRERIHEVLDSTTVLTLPSQPSPTWREQIGLPIVEGLSHGCRVVTTSETSLHGWLTEHGHEITHAATSPESLADALVRALDGGPSRDEVLATLPERDSRLLADDWLFGREDDVADDDDDDDERNTGSA